VILIRGPESCFEIIILIKSPKTKAVNADNIKE